MSNLVKYNPPEEDFRCGSRKHGKLNQYILKISLPLVHGVLYEYAMPWYHQSPFGSFFQIKPINKISNKNSFNSLISLIPWNVYAKYNNGCPSLYEILTGQKPIYKSLILQPRSELSYFEFKHINKT